MPKLATQFRGDFRFFAFYLANGTIDAEVLPVGTDYSVIFREPSALEQVFAIWSNVIELDEHGVPMNAAAARRRAAQYIRTWIDESYVVEPSFSDEELELHL